MKVSRELAASFVFVSIVLAIVILLLVPLGVRFPGLPDRRGDGYPPFLLVVPTLLLGLVALILAVIKWRIRRRRDRPRPIPAHEAETLAKAASVQAKRAGEFVERVTDSVRRDQLSQELHRLQSEGVQEVSTLHVVVFGTVSAGKTSLINAFLGREAGPTDAVMGTTQHGETFTYELRSVEAAVFLTDTPGLSEAGEGGKIRETEARALAARADLLLFVIDHDLIRSEYEPLIELARLGKRSIVVLNKKDRFPEADLAAIVTKLRERLSGVIDPADIVAVAAAPRPLPVLIQRPDGSFETVQEQQPPDIAPLRSRIGQVLHREGKLLHAANLLVRGRLLEEDARAQLALERERRALAVVDHYQWITTGAVFANPIPALDIMAGGAVQLEMVAELARVHGVELSPGHVRSLAGQMVQGVLKLGLIEAGTSLVAGIFKRTLVGFAAGGAVQAVTMGYLTRVSGKAFIDYFDAGQSWGSEGIHGTLLRQFELTSRAEFLQDFAGQVVFRVLRKIQPVSIPGASAVDSKGGG
jgi:small GTP-binding protein